MKWPSRLFCQMRTFFFGIFPRILTPSLKAQCLSINGVSQRGLRLRRIRH